MSTKRIFNFSRRLLSATFWGFIAVFGFYPKTKKPLIKK